MKLLLIIAVILQAIVVLAIVETRYSEFLGDVTFRGEVRIEGGFLPQKALKFGPSTYKNYKQNKYYYGHGKEHGNGIEEPTIWIQACEPVGTPTAQLYRETFRFDGADGGIIAVGYKLANGTTDCNTPWIITPDGKWNGSLDGLKGGPGPAGPAGPPGPPGPPGPQGRNATGDKGDKGQKGETGPKGDQGVVGDKGDQGVVGDKGEPGPKGDQGVVGDKGDQGPQGPIGPKGDQGPQGVNGTKGDKGDPGSTGPIGPPGPKGNQGPAGSQGAQGPMGPPGTNCPIRGYYYLFRNPRYITNFAINGGSTTGILTFGRSTVTFNISDQSSDVLFTKSIDSPMCAQFCDRVYFFGLGFWNPENYDENLRPDATLSLIGEKEINGPDVPGIGFTNNWYWILPSISVPELTINSNTKISVNNGRSYFCPRPQAFAGFVTSFIPRSRNDLGNLNNRCLAFVRVDFLGRVHTFKLGTCSPTFANNGTFDFFTHLDFSGFSYVASYTVDPRPYSTNPLWYTANIKGASIYEAAIPYTANAYAKRTVRKARF